METYSTALTVIAIILLRFGLPILVTVLFVYFLRRVDARWQKQAQEQMANSPKLIIQQTPCWEVNGCPPEKKYACRAFMKPEIPCWQQFRSPDGMVRESCLACSVFRNAKVPVTV
jgi:hypothetical protein